MRDDSSVEEMLRGKRILIVGRDYYFYTREIARELAGAFGASVDFNPIEPSAFLFKLWKKTGLSRDRWLERHHEKIIAANRGSPPDIVLFVQVHQAGRFVESYRRAFAAARFVLYNWDSLQTHDYRPYMRYFDRVFTFDRLDAKRVANLQYLPLFYAERFRALRQEQEFAHDLSFVGVAVSRRRYEQLVEVRNWAKQSGVSLYDHLVVSVALFAGSLLRGRRLRGVHFRSLSERELLRVYGRSRAVLDLPNNVQSGYTMRTFEALGSHRKLITSNRNILNEDFYTPESVFVIDIPRQYPQRAFLFSRPVFPPALEHYSLRRWILRLLDPAPPDEPRMRNPDPEKI